MLKKLGETGGPNPADYKLPSTSEEWKSMMKMMDDCGIEKEKAMEMIKERKNKFIQACVDYYC